MFRAKVIGPHCALGSTPRGAEGRGFQVSGGEAQRCAWAETRRGPWTFQAQLPSSYQAPLWSVPTSELRLPTRLSDKPLPPNENSSNMDFKKSHVLSHCLHPVCASHPQVGDSVRSTHPQRPPRGFLSSLCAGSQVVRLSALGFILPSYSKAPMRKRVLAVCLVGSRGLCLTDPQGKRPSAFCAVLT